MCLLRPIAIALFALAAMPAFAQAPSPLVIPQQDSLNTTALPIIRNNQLEGYLLIESGSAYGERSALDRILGREATPSVGAGFSLPLASGRRVGTSLVLESNPSLGLLCDGSTVSRSFGALAQHCMVASLAPGPGAPLALSQPGVRAQTRLEGDRTAFTASLGLNQFDLAGPMVLPGALAAPGASLPLSLRGADFEQEDIGVLGEFELGESGWITIGGTVARARIVSANQLPGGIRPEWNTGVLSLGGGVGNFGGEIVGRVVEVPGTATQYSNLGLGVTWRAPWRARLSVGAENLATHGQNPFATGNADDGEDSRVPYIRYEQDL